MPFFKFRRGEASSAPPAGVAAQVESVEVIRKRAKHRLIGASVLVLLGVVVFPLLFDTQPRPVSVDIPIEIPGKNTVKPLGKSAPVKIIPVAPAASSEKVSAAASLSPKEEIVPSRPPAALVAAVPPVVKKEARPEPRREAKPDARTEEKAEAKLAIKLEVRPVRKPADAESARAAAPLKELDTPPKPAAQAKNRTVVQVGAFSDVTKIHETRWKLERAGLKTYTQVIDTKEGKRTRIRVGPFETKAEAEKVSDKIRALDLPTAILTF